MGKRKTKAKGRCLMVGPDEKTGRMTRCKHPARAMGLCRSDYDAVRAAVRAGTDTWERHFAEGTAAPANKNYSTYTRAKRSAKRRQVSQ